MNIYAIEGHKVRCSTFDAGYDYDKEIAKRYLEIGREYTIASTIVDGWSTDVYLKKFPHIRFNSVFFEDVVEQSDEDDMKHPDWRKYNRL
jgi:hypothetical protein